MTDNGVGALAERIALSRSSVWYRVAEEVLADGSRFLTPGEAARVAALDDLSHEWHNAGAGGMTVKSFRVHVNAIRAAFENGAPVGALSERPDLSLSPSTSRLAPPTQTALRTEGQLGTPSDGHPAWGTGTSGDAGNGHRETHSDNGEGRVQVLGWRPDKAAPPRPRKGRNTSGPDQLGVPFLRRLSQAPTGPADREALCILCGRASHQPGCPALAEERPDLSLDAYIERLRSAIKGISLPPGPDFAWVDGHRPFTAAALAEIEYARLSRESKP
jgi:hypothetical protein